RCRAARRGRRRRGRRAVRGAAAGRAGRHLPAQGPPHPRPPRRAPGPARHGARGRSRAGPRAPRPHAGAHGQDPGQDPADARPGRDARRRAPAPARDVLRDHRLRDRAHRLAPPAHVAARAHRVRRVPLPADERRGQGAAQAPRRGRRLRALHAQGLPRPEAVLRRGPGHDRAHARRDDPALRRARRARGGHRHGAPRPPQRPRPQPRPPLRDDLRRVRGRLDARGDHHDPAGRHGRREVPPRRPGLLRAARRGVHPRQPRVQPVAPGVRAPGRRGRRPRGADDPQGPARAPRHVLRRADRPARRRGLPGPGRRGGVAEPPGPRRLPGRRVAAPDPEQPGRLHHGSRGLALHPLGVGPRQGLRLPHHPRQRRRRVGLHRRGPPGLRLPPGVRPRRGHRPHRLPPLRPQRGRRARLHPARDVLGHQGQAPGRRALRRPPRGGRDHHRGRRRGPAPGDLGPPDPAAPGAQGEAQGGRGRRGPGPADRGVPPGPHALARGDHGGGGRAAAPAQRRAARHPRGLHGPPEARPPARAPAHRGRRRRRDRLGARRGAGLRLAAHGGRARPADGPGRRARDVLPAPPRPARRQDRADDVPDPDPPGRPGPVRAAQLAAQRDRLHGLRVRLRAGGPGDHGHLGGPVRRLRQLRPGDHRPVHHLGPGQVGRELAAHAAAAARLRGLGPRALLGPPGALAPARRGGQHPRGERLDAGAVLPPPAPPGEDRQAAPADRDDAEVAPAPAAGDQPARAPERHAVLPGPRGAAGARGRGHAPHPLHGQGLLRPRRPPQPAGQPRGGHRPRRAALPLPGEADPGAARQLPQPARGHLGPGGAAQHGRPRAHEPAPAADPARPHLVRLRRPPRALVARRGLPRRAQHRAEPHHPHGARHVDPGGDVPRQDPRRAL
ncbi:MAG: 2-oxoglutarate dehydrogenase E1 component, partial [uncultured Solirubrobacteraceae bacterium]